MKKLLSALVLIALAGCALQPWAEEDHARFANRYCGGLQNYDRNWYECKGMQGSMVGKQSHPVQVYTVKPGDADAIRANSPSGTIFNRE